MRLREYNEKRKNKCKLVTSSLKLKSAMIIPLSDERVGKFQPPNFLILLLLSIFIYFFPLVIFLSHVSLAYTEESQ